MQRERIVREERESERTVRTQRGPVRQERKVSSERRGEKVGNLVVRRKNLQSRLRENPENSSETSERKSRQNAGAAGNPGKQAKSPGEFIKPPVHPEKREGIREAENRQVPEQRKRETERKVQQAGTLQRQRKLSSREVQSRGGRPREKVQKIQKVCSRKI